MMLEMNSQCPESRQDPELTSSTALSSLRNMSSGRRRWSSSGPRRSRRMVYDCILGAKAGEGYGSFNI